jgi:N-methylhydantoinase A/oxoprolinase/acetone carboxylase beta subunit
MGWRIGVDAGGTFTAFAALAATTGIPMRPELSTAPAELGRDAGKRLGRLGGSELAVIRPFMNGTTVGVSDT